MFKKNVNNQFIKIYKKDLKIKNLKSDDIIVFSYLKNELNISKMYYNENFITITDNEILKNCLCLSKDKLKKSIKRLKDNHLIFTEVKKNSSNKYYRKLFIIENENENENENELTKNIKEL